MYKVVSKGKDSNVNLTYYVVDTFNELFIHDAEVSDDENKNALPHCEMGSEAYVIEKATKYVLDSNGFWHDKDSGALVTWTAPTEPTTV